MRRIPHLSPLLCAILLGLLCCPATAAADPSCTIRISDPSEFHSIPSILSATLAQQKALMMSATGTDGFTSDVHLCFEPGKIYSGSSRPLVLNGAQHNHPDPTRKIVWRAAKDPSIPPITGRAPLITPQESAPKPPTEPTMESPSSLPPPLLSGGSPLTKWYRCDDGTHCPGYDWHGVWVHYVADIANLTADLLPVRQLWVNGSRAARVSVEGDTLGWTTTATGYTGPQGFTAPSSYVTNEVELAWPKVVRNWIEPRCIVTAVAGSNITVDPQCWAALKQRNNNQLPPPPTIVENIVRPPGPGEFAATPQYIFYRPPASDPYASPPVDAFVPVQAKIMEAAGLRNHRFDGLGFAHATWRIPSAKGGYVPSQTLVSASQGEPFGAVQFTGARELYVKNCMFHNIGAAYALDIGQASQNVVVSGCTLRDLSGGAVKVGNVNNSRALSTNAAEWDTGFTIENNLMQSVSVEFRGGAAVFAGYVAHTTIAQNTIRQTGYTGISLGWGWGTHVTGPQTFATDNIITGNRLEAVMSALNDGGCTYTLGPQPRSFVTNNYCSMDAAPVVGCFYHDNGSRFFGTRNNVCTTSPAPCVYLQGCCNSPAYDIAVSNLWCRATAPVMNGCAKENCTIDQATLYTLKAGDPWPAAAQAIVDEAGAGAGK